MGEFIQQVVAGLGDGAIYASLALDASSRAYVLEAGRVALEGTSAELRRDESVRRSYLGY